MADLWSQLAAWFFPASFLSKDMLAIHLRTGHPKKTLQPFGPPHLWSFQLLYDHSHSGWDKQHHISGAGENDNSDDMRNMQQTCPKDFQK